MKLVSLYANNFKKLKFEAPLRFPNGISVISGLNEAGKSTVLDAILYALYGKVTRPPGHVKDEDLLAYTTGRATIILEFTIGEKLYKVTREIHRNATNRANLEEYLAQDRWKPIATKSREVTASIESLLGNISFDEMISSNIVAQKDMDRLVAQGSDRWKVINAFLHLESFNEAIESLNEEKKDLEGTGPARPGQINTEQEKLEQLSRDLQEYKRREDQNQILGKENKELNGGINTLTPQYKNLETLRSLLTEYDRVETERQKALGEAETKQKLIENHRSAVSTLRSQILGSGEELAKYADLPPEEDMSRLSTLLENLRNSGTKIDTLTESIGTKAAELSAAEKELQGYDQASIQKVTSSRFSLKPYAGGAVGAFIAAFVSFVFLIPILPWLLAAVGGILLAILSINISRMNKLVRSEGLLGKFELYEGKKRELGTLHEDLASAQTKRTEALDKLRTTLDNTPRYRQLSVDKEVVERAGDVLKQFAVDAENKRSIGSNITALSKGVKELAAQMDEENVQRQMTELSKKAAELVPPALPEDIKFSEELLTKVAQEKEAVGRSISDKQARIDSNMRIMSDNENYLKDHAKIENNVKSQQVLVQSLIHKLKVVKAAKEGIEKTGESRRLRFHPGVENYMGDILPSLTSGRYKAVMLDESFGVQVFDPEAGEYRPKDVFSGGTEDQFLLAMRLAFALALIPEVKGTAPQFLWLDEPLGSSDEVRRSGMIEYLNVKLSRLFSQIFIVSHVGGLEEQIPNVIRLENGRVLA